MKGDRMPTILPPLAMEEYTDTWFDFLLDPIKLNNHLKDISSGKSNHPNVSMIIKTFLKQFEKYTVLQQQHLLQQQLDNTPTIPTSPSSSPPHPPPLPSTSTSTTTSTTSSTTTTSKRSKLIIDLVINVITNLKFSLDDFEKNIPIKHQRTILEQLESKTDVDIEYQTFLNRWILRGIIKGTPIKYLLSNYTSSPSSPNLQSLNNGGATSNNTTPSSCPSTPPSTPPPTPPSFISLQQQQSQPAQQQQQQNSSDTNTSLEELFYKSNLFLNEWISENYDEDKPSDIDQVVPIVLFELGEFQFYKENFYDARKLFDRANKIITSPQCLAVIEKSNQQFKIESSNIKSVVGNKFQQLSEYKEKIQCLIIACKTIDLYDNGDQQKMDTDSNTSGVGGANYNYENNKNFQIEKALSSNNIQQVIKILDLDMLDYSSSTSLDFNFRLNLEFNILPSSLKLNNNNGQSTTLLSVHFGNLIKSTIQYQHYNYSLDEFKEISKESSQIFFSLVQEILKQGNQIYTDKIEFLLFKIFNIISNDKKLHYPENNNFIQILKSTLPTLFEKINSTTITSNGKVDIQVLIGSGNNSLLFNNFIKENEPIKINNLLELLKQQFNLGVQQCNSILYQKSLDLFEQGELEKSKTILIEYLGGNSSKSYNSIDYQLYLYNLILKTYKQQQEGMVAAAGPNKIKTNPILMDSFKLLFEKHGPPSEYIAERIFATLLNKRKWEVTKFISNTLKSNSDHSSASFSELVYIANHLSSIGKMVDSEEKERIKQLALSASIQSSIDSAISTSSNDIDETNDNNDINNNNNNNNNNNGGSNTHENSDREDSDMDIDDDFTSATTYTTNSSNQSTASTSTPTTSSSTNSKLTINSKSEDIYIGFLSSILPRYEQKSIHWTFIIGNKFYCKNSNQVAGLLNLLDNKSLYNRIVFLFVGLIHSIQVYKKVQNDLNLDLYNEFSTKFSNTIIFPNKHFSIEIEPLILNVYLDTLNRMNKIFGIKIEEKEKKLQLRSSGGIESMTVFKNGRNLIYIGDIYFEKKFHRESLRYYLLGCSLENAFFSDSTKTLITNSKYLHNLSRRLFDCFYFLRAPMQAIVVSQLFGNLNQTCLVSFKIIQEEYYQLDSNYFQYIWEIPLLEILLNTFTKQKDIKKVYLLNQILSNPNINEFNHPEIRKNYINNSKINFFKDISSSYLLS